MATKKIKKGTKAGGAAAKKRPLPKPTKPTKRAKKGPGAARTVAKSVAKKPAAKKARKMAPPPKATKATKAKKATKATKAKKAMPARKEIAAAARKPKKKATPAAPPARPIRRRDALGHLDPKYAADLRRRSGKEKDDDGAFLGGRARSSDDLAESLGEQFVTAATSGEDEGEEVLDQVVPEERGGPFVESTAGAEFADGTDASNPEGAKREPFPTT